MADSKTADRLNAEATELGRLRRQVSFHERIRRNVEAVLDHALGTEEKDGAGQGLAADVELLAQRLQQAEAAIERVQSFLADTETHCSAQRIDTPRWVNAVRERLQPPPAEYPS